MFVGCLVAAMAATVGLVVLSVLQLDTPPPPPPGSDNASPPPPHEAFTIGLTVVAALFAIAWVATIVAHVRDQLLRQFDRQREQITTAVSATMAEFGEQRETDGYLHGRRQGLREAEGGGPRAEVRHIHPVRPAE